MMNRKNAIIDASINIKVYACYCNRANYMKIAQLCLALGIHFINYSHEYLVFSEDVSEILKREDASLEFSMYAENWGCLGDALGHEITINYVSTEMWNAETQQTEKTIYHRQ